MVSMNVYPRKAQTFTERGPRHVVVSSVSTCNQASSQLVHDALPFTLAHVHGTVQALIP